MHWTFADYDKASVGDIQAALEIWQLEEKEAAAKKATKKR